MKPLRQRLFAEFLGTTALLAIIVGSGHMGETLAGGNMAVALFANSTATGLGLWVLIELLGPISGAHFNPAVSTAFAWRGELPGRDAAAYTFVQIGGAICGVVLAHLMFDLAPIQIGIKPRTGTGQWLSEAVATAGLLLTILLGLRIRPGAVAGLVSAFIACAYWFTASTSFANPAVTIARSLTRTFAGIRPLDVPAFVIAEIAGTVCALLLLRLLAPAAQRGR
ncbi:MAG: aquaporin family protein [Proteobacteria bacterium]|nr:aquaporin family protein [Pseudomonadota bacterium]